MIGTRILVAMMGMWLVGMDAWAGWEVTYLNAPGCTECYGMGVNGEYQTGVCRQEDVPQHAGYWKGSAGSWTDIHPAGASWSFGHKVTANVIGGTVNSQAYLWTITPGGIIGIPYTPGGATQSAIWATSGDRSGGYGTFPHLRHAVLWTGSAGSAVDVHPQGAEVSDIRGISEKYAVGLVDFGYGTRAGYWNADGSSWTELPVAGAWWSVATGVGGDVAVGEASYIDYLHALMWDIPTGKVTKLNPMWATDSGATAVSGNRQVGSAGVNGQWWHATIWSGTAESAEDLHEYLDTGYGQSFARDVYISGDEIWVIGDAWRTGSSRVDAVLWHYRAVPEPGTWVLLLMGLAGVRVQKSRRFCGYIAIKMRA